MLRVLREWCACLDPKVIYVCVSVSCGVVVSVEPCRSRAAARLNVVAASLGGAWLFVSSSMEIERVATEVVETTVAEVARDVVAERRGGRASWWPSVVVAERRGGRASWWPSVVVAERRGGRDASRGEA
jgi:hypothetical protein